MKLDSTDTLRVDVTFPERMPPGARIPAAGGRMTIVLNGQPILTLENIQSTSDWLWFHYPSPVVP